MVCTPGTVQEQCYFYALHSSGLLWGGELRCEEYDRIINCVEKCHTSFFSIDLKIGKGKGVPLQARTDSQGSRRSRLPDF
jgi:hypothetical protein